MPDKPPPDPADHAEDFAHRYAEPLDQAVAPAHRLDPVVGVHLVAATV